MEDNGVKCLNSNILQTISDVYIKIPRVHQNKISMNTSYKIKNNIIFT